SPCVLAYTVAAPAGRAKPPVWPATRPYGGAVAGDTLTFFLGGDVMTGRGIDQVLAHPGDPRLWEPYVDDARTYVELAEQANGRVPRPVDDTWPGGDALAVLDAAAPDLRLVNLETSVTRSDDVAVGKTVHYRMTPENVGCLTAARLDVCVLANNHVLDFGARGLADTVATLAGVGIATVGAGADRAAAERPAVLSPGGRRVVVASCGTVDSGIPASWAATPGRGGVYLLPRLSPAAADRLADQLGLPAAASGQVSVVSLHWGSNWGYGIPPEHVEFAHRLIDRGVDIIHGHSSHHPRPIEVY